jgi:hypothetical protein
MPPAGGPTRAARRCRRPVHSSHPPSLLHSSSNPSPSLRLVHTPEPSPRPPTHPPTPPTAPPLPRPAPPAPGNCGISVNLPAPANKLPAGQDALAALFAEELGLVLEVGVLSV